jgi:polysaccharide export outer membrane protein
MCDAHGALGALRAQRMRSEQADQFTLGPGDELQISAADLPEINNASARVDGQGFIDLALLGRIRVAGLTDSEVSQVISDSAGKYQKVPRVHVIVVHFASRNVEVMGMVAEPGSYTLVGPDESLLNVLGRAGGIKGLGSEDAADLVFLFPANTGSSVSGHIDAMQSEVACATGASASGSCRGLGAMSQAAVKPVAWVPANRGAAVDPIIIDLTKPAMVGCLDTPARPGDVIMVPAAGQVGVYGWVARPGSFNITPGMTVLGAITAAGGATFSSNAEILRTEGGTRVSIPVDLAKVESASENDPPVQAGDIVLIKASVVGALPYAVYTLFTKFGTGLYLSPVGL